MATKRQIDKLEIQRQAEKVVLRARKLWLKQVLNWPLKNGPLADRCTKAEIAALKKAAEKGNIFHGA